MDPSDVDDAEHGNDEEMLAHFLALWTFFEQRAGTQKDRMIAIGSSLLAINAALLGFAFSETLKAVPDCDPGKSLIVASFVGCMIALVAVGVIVDFKIHFSRNLERANKLRQDHKSLDQLIKPIMRLSTTPPFFWVVLAFTLVLLTAHLVLLFASKYVCNLF